MQMNLISDDCDSWNLKSLENKHVQNSSINSISEALDHAKGVEFQAKKVERERLKEVARVKRSNQRLESKNGESLSTVSSNDAAKGKVQSTNASDVHVRDITISVGTGKLLLDNAVFKIIQGRKYGLIGKNGCGKSTLLNAISSRQLEGIPLHLSVVHVEQVS